MSPNSAAELRARKAIERFPIPFLSPFDPRGIGGWPELENEAARVAYFSACGLHLARDIIRAHPASERLQQEIEIFSLLIDWIEDALKADGDTG